jgi:hypothetical protein
MESVLDIFHAIMQWASDNASLLSLLAWLSLLLLVMSVFLLPLYINNMPADYFTNASYHLSDSILEHPIRNALGVVIIFFGILMLVLPGQGIAAIIVGFMLMKFPGKHALMLQFVRKKSVLSALNWVRRQGKQAEFTL